MIRSSAILSGAAVVLVAANLGCSRTTPYGSNMTLGPVSGPCAVSSTCSIQVSIEGSGAAGLTTENISYKVIRGCPRVSGIRPDAETQTIINGSRSTSPSANLKRNSSLRSAMTLVTSRNEVILLPSMNGTVATIAIFYGSDPGKYTVVDFSGDVAQGAAFGYAYYSGRVLDDPGYDRFNWERERRICG